MNDGQFLRLLFLVCLLADEVSLVVLFWSIRNRNNEALSGSLAFVPWILQEAYLQGDVHPETLVLHRGSGAVVFSDASGFTALTERLALKTNGAELLSQCLTSFFTPLIQPLVLTRLKQYEAIETCASLKEFYYAHLPCSNRITILS